LQLTEKDLDAKMDGSNPAWYYSYFLTLLKTTWRTTSNLDLIRKT
jgi:hypothetical protein